MTARDGARALAAGRVVAGAALLAAPTLAGRGWIGRDAGRAGPRVFARGLGVRDLVLAGIALHTVDNPQVGPRWVATCAAVDAVDCLVTIAARRELPRLGGSAITAVAGTAAIGGAVLAQRLRASAPGVA